MKIFKLLIFIFYIQNINAQDKLVDENIALQKDLIEVVVTGQLSETNAEDAIHKIRVIGSKELNSGLFTDLASVLSKKLNIRLSEDNILGSSISIQGISGQNVKILIDDVPVIGRLNGNIDLSQISLNNIERIEIVEGPLSTIYGSDALAGTINIITKEQVNKKLFTSYYETIGKYNYDFILSENIKENAITYQFGRKFFNGWSPNQSFRLFPSEELADKNRSKQWKPKEQISHKLSYKINKDLYSSNNYIEMFNEKITNRGTPQEPYYENAFDEYYYTFRRNYGSSIKFKYEKHKIRLLLAHNKYIRTKETFYKNLTDLSEIIVLDESMQDTSEFNLWMLKFGISNYQNNKLKYQIGLDINNQSAKGNRISNNYQEKSDNALFSIIEYKANESIIIRPSLRIIHNTKYKAPIIPAINTLFNWRNNKLRISYAKGFRAPDFKELFFEFIDINHNIVGNKLLLAEESNNLNINITSSKKILKTIIVTDLSLFYNNISNKIDLIKSSLQTNQYSYFNIEKYETKGISYRSTISLSNTEINFGISYIGRYNKLANEYNIAKFNFSKDINISALFQIGKKTKFNIFYKKTGKIPIFTLDDNNDAVEVYSDSYNMLDLSINRKIFNDLIITLGAKNLFNVFDINQSRDNNTVHSNNNNTISVGYGRTFFTSLKFEL